MRFCLSGNRLSTCQMCYVLPTKARMWPMRFYLTIMLSNHQLSSQGPGESGPNMIILGKISIKFENGLSQVTQIISPDWEALSPLTECSSHVACANWLHFLLSGNISAGTNQHTTRSGPAVGQIICDYTITCKLCKCTWLSRKFIASVL